jgi:hypothetical protein
LSFLHIFFRRVSIPLFSILLSLTHTHTHTHTHTQCGSWSLRMLLDHTEGSSPGTIIWIVILRWKLFETSWLLWSGSFVSEKEIAETTEALAQLAQRPMIWNMNIPLHLRFSRLWLRTVGYYGF